MQYFKGWSLYSQVGKKIGAKVKNIWDIDTKNCPVKGLSYEPISKEEYENTFFDLRFEDGEWQK